MSGHTPGPWTVEDRVERLMIWAEGRTEEVAILNVPDRDDVEADVVAQADADLIAAAPDLLEALKELVARREKACAALGGKPDGTDGRYARARAAIAKAEGRS